LNRRNRVRVPVTLMAMAMLTGCGGADDAAPGEVVGAVEADGSSTVFPVTEAVAEEFGIETGGDVRVTVAYSGTGGGFRRFCTGETDLNNASRPILPSEVEICEQNGVDFIELQVAWDGLAVIVSPANDFVQCLTVDELRRIWEPGSTVTQWSDVRPEWPDRPLRLYGPGTNSGTFDYFTEEIGGEIRSSRSDYTASEDDNVLVQGVAGDVNALGYFGFAYYVENQSRLKLVGVDDGNGCVLPDAETIESGRYSPLSRPLFIYVKRESLERPAAAAFVDFYLSVAPELVSEIGYIPMSAARYEEERAKLPAVPDA
jgi:phosphate transport system substrate-binding protein